MYTISDLVEWLRSDYAATMLAVVGAAGAFLGLLGGLLRRLRP